MKRQKEIEELQKIADKIKKYMKENKQKLLQQKSEDERKIQAIKIANNPNVREVLISKQRMKSGTSISSASFMTDSDDEDFSVPQERDWHSDMKVIK